MARSDKILTDSRLYWTHAGVLVAGCALGLLAAYYVVGIYWDFSGELKEARSLGIVSRTILSGYAKSMDLVTYLTALGLPVLVALGLWLLWCRGERRNNLQNIFCREEALPAEKNRRWFYCLLIVAGLYAIITFNINYFYQAVYNDYVGAWSFLGEEGENLAWVQSLLSGGVYGKDFFCLYGPLLIYPLSWAMKLFGTTVLVERIYTYSLNLIAYGIAIAFLYRTLRLKTVFVVSAGILLFSCANFILSPNCSYLRVYMGLLPLLLAYCYFEKNKGYLLLPIGVTLGLSMLFSQEVGACVLLSLVIVFFIRSIQQHNIPGFVREGSVIGASCLAAVTPFLVYFYLNGALGTFFNSIYGYPRLVTLGFGALPFPGLRSFLAAPLAPVSFDNYWIICVYIVAALYLIPLLILGKRDSRHLLQVALLLFGILLFRSALGRSGYVRANFVSPPAFMLIFIFFDTAVTGMIRNKQGFAKAGALLVFIGTVVLFYLLITKLPFSQMTLSGLKNDFSNLSTKWTPIRMPFSKPTEIQRAGVYFNKPTRESIIKIQTFLEAYTQRGEYVYFFPNEAAYYFLFDRANPTRYAFSYLAITREQRLELVADLAAKKPRYVVFSQKTWRVDDIPETTAVPEVVAYLNQNYRFFVDLGGVLILKRVDG